MTSRHLRPGSDCPPPDYLHTLFYIDADGELRHRERPVTLMTSTMKKLTKASVAFAVGGLLALAGCTTNPIYNTGAGAGTGAATGAAIGCLATIPVGCLPGAAVGAAVGAAAGGTVGAASTVPPPGYAYAPPPPVSAWPAPTQPYSASYATEPYYH
jgi:hypothetical protein